VQQHALWWENARTDLKIEIMQDGDDGPPLPPIGQRTTEILKQVTRVRRSDGGEWLRPSPDTDALS